MPAAASCNLPMAAALQTGQKARVGRDQLPCILTSRVAEKEGWATPILKLV